MHTKTLNAVFKNGFSPVLGLIPRLPELTCEFNIANVV